MSNLGQRVATAVLLLPPVAAALWAGGLWGGILISAAAVVGTAEYYRMVLGKVDLDTIPGLAGAGFLPLIPVLHLDPAWPFWVLVGASMVAWCSQLFLSRVLGAPMRVGHILAGVLFVGGGTYALSSLRMMSDGRSLVLLTLLGTWLNDLCAYAGGHLLGRRRLAPSVSPGKT